MQRNITKKYLRQIRRLYKGKHKIKKNFLDELEQDLLHYQKTHPNADYNDLLTQFGEPSEFKTWSPITHSPNSIKKYDFILVQFFCLFYNTHYSYMAYNSACMCYA